MITGYDLLDAAQREDLDRLTESQTHCDTMRFTGLDALHLAEYEALMLRLETEWRKDSKDDL